MKAVITISTGGPAILSITECSLPTTGKGEVHIGVRALDFHMAKIALIWEPR